jgi:hypothetical protein
MAGRSVEQLGKFRGQVGDVALLLERVFISQDKALGDDVPGESAAGVVGAQGAVS